MEYSMIRQACNDKKAETTPAPEAPKPPALAPPPEPYNPPPPTTCLGPCRECHIPPPPPPHWGGAVRRPMRVARVPHMEDFERISRNPRFGYVEHTRTWRASAYPPPPPHRHSSSYDCYHAPPPPPPHADYHHYSRPGSPGGYQPSQGVHHYYHPHIHNDYYGGYPDGCPMM